MKQEVANIIQDLLVDKLNVKPGDFNWNSKLNELNEEFELLGHLVYFEQLLNKQFEKNISLIEYISTDIHTPNDIVELVMKEIK